MSAESASIATTDRPGPIAQPSAFASFCPNEAFRLYMLKLSITPDRS
jgi:hypothetical protein